MAAKFNLCHSTLVSHVYTYYIDTRVSIKSEVSIKIISGC